MKNLRLAERRAHLGPALPDQFLLPKVHFALRDGPAVEVTGEVAAPDLAALDVIQGMPPAPVVIPAERTLTAAPFMWDAVSAPKVTAAVPAEQAREVVTEVIALTPSELRRKARTLHRQAVRSTSRPVTIKTLQDELGLSRREATELRREVVTETAS